MPITRDPDFPAEIANLLSAFNTCSDGYSTYAVLEASANLLIAAVGTHARAIGQGRDWAIILAGDIGRAVEEQVKAQWDRQPQATDIEVRHG